MMLRTYENYEPGTLIRLQRASADAFSVPPSSPAKGRGRGAAWAAPDAPAVVAVLQAAEGCAPVASCSDEALARSGVLQRVNSAGFDSSARGERQPQLSFKRQRSSSDIEPSDA